MDTNNRRTDAHTSRLVEEALRFQRAFNRETAIRFLELSGHHAAFAEAVLASPYDRRQRPTDLT